MSIEFEKQNVRHLWQSLPVEWKKALLEAARDLDPDLFREARDAPRVGWAVVPTDMVVADAPPDSLHCVVVGAASIFEACRDAHQMAVLAAHPVVVYPDSDPEGVGRAWWQATYGETPEESARRR